MQNKRTILLMDRLAFWSEAQYYPFVLKKKIHADGRATYTVEMRISRYDVIVSDAPTLEEVLKRHEELMSCAFETRNLQGRVVGSGVS